MPGSNQRAIEKAKGLAADSLVLDLEDAVAPQAKAEARKQVVKAVRAGGFGRREIIVRVNGMDTEWGRDDLTAVANTPLDGVLLPKVETPQDIQHAVEILDAAGGPPNLPLWFMAETPRGILGAESIAASSPRLTCLVVGTADLAKDLRVVKTPDRSPLLTSLSLCVLAARAHGLDVLDGVHELLNDETGFAAACRQGRELGFDGKTLIHPRQVEYANRAFSPSEEEIGAAKEIVDTWEAAHAAGHGVTVVRGRLAEKLHAEQARRILELAAAIAALSEDVAG